MKRLFLCAAFATLVAGIGAIAAEKKVELTGKNTTIKFVGYKPDGKHEGGFKELKGTFAIDSADPTKAKIDVEIDMESTWSDDEKLTGHLKAPDFFGVKANPKSKFVSTKIEKSGDGYTVTGDLTLNGKTKSISFPAKLSADGLTTDFKLKRSEFGIVYGAGKINEEVDLSIKVNAK